MSQNSCFISPKDGKIEARHIFAQARRCSCEDRMLALKIHGSFPTNSDPTFGAQL
jgi:hypothetical protein